MHLQMRKSVIIKLISGFVNVLTGLIVALIVLFFQNWFGSDDLASYMFWTIPLAVGFAIFGPHFLQLFSNLDKTYRIFFMILIAVVIAFIWLYMVYLALGPWINAFSIPVFYLWIIGNVFQLLFLDWQLPKQKAKKTTVKIILGILGLPLTAIACAVLLYAISFFSAYLSKPEPETYLIPSEYEGRFKVIYGEKCGISPNTENGRRVLEIADNGILIIQTEFKSGVIDHEYYFVDETGNRTRVERYENYKDGTKNIPGIRLVSSGSIAGKMPDGSSSTESPLAIRYTEFHVYRDTIDRYDFKQERKFDSLTIALVNQCRMKAK